MNHKINSQAYNHKNIYERHNNLIKNKTNYSFQYVKSSKDYWENRYASGGNSGEGSYNKYAEFKASVLNNFVKEKKVNTIIEWGSGDCNQLSLSNYKNYIGYDVSITAINICKNKFLNDSSKMFIHVNDNFINKKKADLSLSLDVIYHLIEDNIFNSYMKNLFTSSNKYVIIYSSNYNNRGAPHIKHRKFTDWIDKYVSANWKIIKYIPNKFSSGLKKNSIDFYIYEKNNVS